MELGKLNDAGRTTGLGLADGTRQVQKPDRYLGGARPLQADPQLTSVATDPNLPATEARVESQPGTTTPGGTTTVTLQQSPVVIQEGTEAAHQPVSTSLLEAPTPTSDGQGRMALLEEAVHAPQTESGTPMLALVQPQIPTQVQLPPKPWKDSGLSDSDRTVLEAYLLDPRFPPEAEPYLRDFMAGEFTSNIKQHLGQLLQTMYGDALPDSVRVALKPHLLDPHPMDHPPDFKMRVPDAPVEEQAPAPKTSLVGSALRALLKVENRVMAVGGKDKAEITYAKTVKQINDFEPGMKRLSDTQLAAKTQEFKDRLAAGETLDDILPEAFAAVREAAFRSTGMRPFDVQLIGAIAMAHGQVAEMGTGEGKTLTAVLPVYLHALAGKGAMVVTVNDTLVQRDAANMSPIYNALGLSVGTVVNTQPPDMEAKKKGYAADVTYVTNSTLGFDYLRDNMAKRPEDVVQRPFHFALVDEVDEILIDEARTPLILAEPADPGKFESERVAKLAPIADLMTPQPSLSGAAEYKRFVDIMRDFAGADDKGYEDTEHDDDRDYKVDFKKKTTKLTPAGEDKLVERLGFAPWAPTDLDKLEQAVERLQKAGQPVTVSFASRDEAREYLDRLDLAGKKHVESQKPYGHPADVIGVTYPDAKKALRVHPVQDNAVNIWSSDFDYTEYRAFIKPTLDALALYQRDKHYLVEESPEWTQERNEKRLQILYSIMPPQDQQHVEQVANHSVDAAIKQLAETGQAPPGLLRAWWNNQNPKPNEIPAKIHDALVQRAGFDELSRVLEMLPDQTRTDLEARLTQEKGTDPNGVVNIVDEFTGRVMEGRRFSAGLHQALEAKEQVPVNPEQQTNASITYPELFGLFPMRAGMSGTAKSEEEELQKLYGMSVAVVPPNKESQRKDLDDLIYKTTAEKYNAIADKVEELWKKGQPVLVGTRSVEVNDILSKILDERGIPHNVLNAKSVKGNTAEENNVLADAGRIGAVTIATNMAGRGVDIKTDQINYQQLGTESVDALGLAAKATRVRNMEALYAAMPQPERDKIDVQTQAQTLKVFQQLRRNALAKDMPAADLAQIRKDAGDPKVVGLEAFRTAVSAALDVRLAGMDADARNALAGAQPSAELVHDIQANLVAQARGLDPRVSYMESDRGVGVSFKKLAEARRLAQRLIAQGVPVAWAEPGTRPEHLKPGCITIIVKGGSKQPLGVPDGAPRPLPAPAFSQPGATQPPLMLDSKAFPSGGLYIIGTERHESRRVDYQLRGRTARQGEDGVSQFYLSLQDDLMKYFGGEKTLATIQKMGVEDGEAISSGMTTGAVTKAQKAVEGTHFDQRTNTTKYSGVLNAQVMAVYKQRQMVLNGIDLSDILLDWIDERLDSTVTPFQSPHHHDDTISDDDAKAMAEQVEANFGVSIPSDASMGYKALAQAAHDAVYAAFEEREKAEGTQGLRSIVLDAMDTNWHSHLDAMSALQQGIGHEATAQKDPLVMYKIRSGDLWDQFESTVHDEALDNIFKGVPLDAPALAA